MQKKIRNKTNTRENCKKYFRLYYLCKAKKMEF